MKCSEFPCGNLFKCPNYYCLQWHLVCDGIWDCPRGSDEIACLDRNCPGMYHCPDSSICLLMSSICDSVKECPNFNDEVFCDLPLCSERCHCLGYMIHCQNITQKSSFLLQKQIPQIYIAIVCSDIDIPRTVFKKMKWVYFFVHFANFK